MELNKDIIQIALAKKRIPAYKMCEDIHYSQAALNHFYKTGEIRPKNKEKIIEYLGLNDVSKTANFKNNEVIEIRNKEVSVSDSFIDKLLSKIESLAVENFSLKRELGKFEGICLTLSS